MLRKEIGPKVKGIFYGEKIEVTDPVTREIEKKPLKPFLVNQMVLLLERGQLRIPNIEVEETIHRQMVNFRVTKFSKAGEPTYTDVDEHGLDAFIFAMTGFMDDYPNLIDIVEEVEMETDMFVVKPTQRDVMERIEKQLQKGLDFKGNQIENNEPKKRYEKVPLGYSKRRKNTGMNGLGWNGSAGKSVWRNKF